MADNLVLPSIKEKVLKTDILSTDSVFRLRDIVWYTTTDGTDTNLTGADIGTVGYGVFEPRTDREEFFTYTGSTITNATTTGVTIELRGLKPGSDYTTEVAGLKRNHPAGSKVILFTNAPAMLQNFAAKNNDETITQTWTFTSTKIPIFDANPTITDDKHVATKKYVDDVAIAGAPDGSATVKGIYEEATVAEQGSATATGATGARLVPANANIVKTSAGAGDENKLAVLDANGTWDDTFLDKARTWSTVQSFTADNAQITSDADSANDAVRQSYALAQIALNTASGTSGEAFSAGDALYIKNADSKLYKTDADATGTTYGFVGFAGSAATGADETIRYIKPGGEVTGLAGLTVGAPYFLSGTAGAIATTAGAVPAKVGIATSNTTLLVTAPDFYARKSGSVSVAFDGTADSVTTTFAPSKVTLIGTDDTNDGAIGWFAKDSDGTTSQFSLGGDASAAAPYLIPSGTNGLKWTESGPNTFTATISLTATGFDITPNNVGGASRTIYYIAEYTGQ